ncbi:MAG: hypothetical protein OHK0037_38080 [Elainellaceae cyanobacterium]
MPNDTAGNTFATARRLRFSSGKLNLSEWIGTGDRDDIYRLNFNKSSNLKITASGTGSTKGAIAHLIQDLNSNGRLDTSEIKARASFRPGQTGKLEAKNLTGTFFLRVRSQGGNLSYKLAMEAAASGTSSTSTRDTQPSGFIAEVLRLTNEFRQQNGVQPLTYNSKLGNAAQGHTINMANLDFFSHTGKDGSTIGQRVTASGYQWSFTGENIAAGYTTPQAVVNGWINSPGHRANMLNPNYQEIGIGYHYLSNDTGQVNYYHYWTQNFGKPL